jgi:hypothetical protein
LLHRHDVRGPGPEEADHFVLFEATTGGRSGVGQPSRDQWRTENQNDPTGRQHGGEHGRPDDATAAAGIAYTTPISARGHDQTTAGGCS